MAPHAIFDEARRPSLRPNSPGLLLQQDRRRPSYPSGLSPKPAVRFSEDSYTSTARARRASSNAPASPGAASKFPDFLHAEAIEQSDDDAVTDYAHRDPNGAPLLNGNTLGMGTSAGASSKRMPFRRQDTWDFWKERTLRVVRPKRQKSLSEAISTVRNRKASISENAHEIAESLKAPVSFRLVMLCLFWFAMSILANASSKAILTALPKPVTLTIAQFVQVALWCLFMSAVAKHNAYVRNAMPVLKNGIRPPTKEIVITTLPLAAFQIGGHILNSDAMSRIPVALVHTIKGLSPLMTVFAYRTFFEYEYTRSTYLSLIPLTMGVFMACSASFHGNVRGLSCALGSTLVFVSQNIFSKKLFDDSAKAEADGVPLRRRKPDKLNLLCYSSAIACVLTLPIWLWSEGLPMLREYLGEGAIELRIRPGSLDHGALALEFLFNGTFMFAQSLVAFVLLGLVSPVTYSVASLIKRVAVIIFAIVWFGNPMTSPQAVGFALTFLGLYLYDRTADADRVDRREREKLQAKTPLLPVNIADAKRRDASPAAAFVDVPMNGDIAARPFVGGSGYVNGATVGSGPGRPVATTGANPYAPPPAPPLAPGTKSEETWHADDAAAGTAR